MELFEEQAAQREDLTPVQALHWDIQRLQNHLH